MVRLRSKPCLVGARLAGAGGRGRKTGSTGGAGSQPKSIGTAATAGAGELSSRRVWGKRPGQPHTAMLHTVRPGLRNERPNPRSDNGRDDSRTQRRGVRRSPGHGPGEGLPAEPAPRRVGARRGPLLGGEEPPHLGQGGLRGHRLGPRPRHPGQGRLVRRLRLGRPGDRQARAPDGEAQVAPAEPVAPPPAGRLGTPEPVARRRRSPTATRPVPTSPGSSRPSASTSSP